MDGVQRTTAALRVRALSVRVLDPRVLQSCFVGMLVLTLLAPVPFTGWHGFSSATIAALALSGAGLALVLIVTPEVTDYRPVIVAMSLAAYATIGVSLLGPDTGTLLLVVLPSLVFARHLGWTGVAVTGLGCTVLTTVPALVAHHDQDEIVRQVVPAPLVSMLAAVMVVVWFEVVRDLRKQAQSALAELELQRRTHEAFVATVDVGLLLLDLDGRELVSNRRMQELARLAYPRGIEHGEQHMRAADGRTVLALEDVPRVRALRGEEFDDVRIWVGEREAVRRALSVTARNMVDEAGRRTGTALAYQDVTELMRASAVKDEFIGLVSHELRTPLTSIYGYVSLLQERDDLPPAAGKHLGVVARNTDRLQLLVKDLLDVTQTVGGGLRLDLQEGDLAELVLNAAQSARPMAEKAGVMLDAVVPGPVLAAIDRVRMAQVLDNLVSNSIKYTPRGGWASVRLSRDADDVVIVVRDSGIGIGEEDLPKVFGRFYRSAQASELAIQGAGLGLSIARAIVEGHGGSIGVTSRLGEGTEFRVLIPALVPVAV